MFSCPELAPSLQQPVVGSYHDGDSRFLVVDALPSLSPYFSMRVERSEESLPRCLLLARLLPCFLPSFLLDGEAEKNKDLASAAPYCVDFPPPLIQDARLNPFPAAADDSLFGGLLGKKSGDTILCGFGWYTRTHIPDGTTQKGHCLLHFSERGPCSALSQPPLHPPPSSKG